MLLLAQFDMPVKSHTHHLIWRGLAGPKAESERSLSNKHPAAADSGQSCGSGGLEQLRLEGVINQIVDKRSSRQFYPGRPWGLVEGCRHTGGGGVHNQHGKVEPRQRFFYQRDGF